MHDGVALFLLVWGAGGLLGMGLLALWDRRVRR